jgi:hypothetical protein
MNNERREAIRKLRVRLDAIRSEIDDLRDQEQIALGNLSENMQRGQKGKAMMNAVNALCEASKAADTIVDAWLGIAAK